MTFTVGEKAQNIYNSRSIKYTAFYFAQRTSLVLSRVAKLESCEPSPQKSQHRVATPLLIRPIIDVWPATLFQD